jgi:dipeptidyl aminopeptidase/acylaminoacyl peptidase
LHFVELGDELTWNPRRSEGIADPARLGIAGLSYGGYMAGWAVGQTDRFAAAVTMSVVSNYV